MVKVRDYIPRYRPGDPRNEAHRRDFNRYLAMHPSAPVWVAQTYADTQDIAREGRAPPPIELSEEGGP